jgi:hypothetical protein
MGKGNEKPEAGGEKKGPAKFKDQCRSQTIRIGPEKAVFLLQWLLGSRSAGASSMGLADHLRRLTCTSPHLPFFMPACQFYLRDF